MLHAEKIIELLEPYPGRAFRMSEIVRYVSSGRSLDLKGRRAMRKAVLRVLAALADSQHVEIRPPRAVLGGPAFYAWKVRHEARLSQQFAIAE